MATCHALVLFASLVLALPARAERCARPDEPSLGRLVGAALRSAALEPARVRGLLRRARASALLPDVTVRLGRGVYDSIRNPDALDPTVQSSDTFRYDVMIRFSLDRLIFDAHELHATEAAGRLVEQRARLTERVSGLWLERRRLEVATEEDAEACAQLGALLDVLTGGALWTVSGPTFSLPAGTPRP